MTPINDLSTSARCKAWAQRKLFHHIHALPEDHYRRGACSEIDRVRMMQAASAWS